tara:strand:- start:173 stop:484 length:312 start_codon:yes stop_codon:yes gene_type:complete
MKPCYKSGWCLPVIIYIFLSVLSILGTIIGMATNDTYKNKSVGLKILPVLTQVVWICLWTFVMFRLCCRDNTGWAWFVLLLPIIVGVVIGVSIGISGNVYYIN